MARLQTEYVWIIYTIIVHFSQPSWQEKIRSKLDWKSNDLTTNELKTLNTEDKFNSSYQLYDSDGYSDVDNLFQTSINDTSLILTDLTYCLSSYNLVDCIRMLLLSQVKALVEDMDETNTTGVDYDLLGGLVTLKWLNTSNPIELNEIESNKQSYPNLSHHLNTYILRLFHSRSLSLSLVPGFGVELAPKSISDQNGLVCFTAKIFNDSTFNSSDETAEVRNTSNRKKKKNKGGGFNMMPMMIVPQMIMLGMLPFALANLKMMVMNAFMINSMALNSAIFMTIRNLVFGPKKGPQVKYVNYGYNKGKKNRKPELILHSPAAFVKKPEKSHNHFTHEANFDQYDDPNSYGHASVNLRRKGSQPWHHRGKEDNFLTSQRKVRRPPHEPNTEFSSNKKTEGSFSNSYNDFDGDKTPHLFTSDPNQFVASNYNEHLVDAPTSYLNNNQYLQPAQISPPVRHQSPQPQEQQTEEQNFEAFDNIYFSPTEKGFRGYTNVENIIEKQSPHSLKYNLQSPDKSNAYEGDDKFR